MKCQNLRSTHYLRQDTGTTLARRFLHMDNVFFQNTDKGCKQAKSARPEGVCGVIFGDFGDPHGDFFLIITIIFTKNDQI